MSYLEKKLLEERARERDYPMTDYKVSNVEDLMKQLVSVEGDLSSLRVHISESLANEKDLLNAKRELIEALRGYLNTVDEDLQPSPEEPRRIQ